MHDISMGQPEKGSFLGLFISPFSMILFVYLACMISVSFDIPAIHDAAILARWPILGLMALVGLVPAITHGVVRSTPILWMGIFLLVAGLSSLWTIDFEYTAMRVFSLILLYIAALIGWASYVRTPRHASNVFDVLFLIASLTAVGGFLFRMGDLGGEGRYVGLHNRATGAGSYAALFLPIIIYQARYRFRGLPAIFSWMVIFALLGQIVLSGARVALVVSLLVCFALWFDFYGKRALVALILLSVIAPIPIILDQRQADKVEERSRRLIRAESLGTFTGRLDRWKFGIEKWTERPIIGFGFGSSRTLASIDQPWRFRLEPGEVFNLHSDQVEALLDLGVMGATPFVLFWISVGLLAWKIILRPRDEARQRGIAALGGTVYAFADTFMHGGFLAAGGGVSSFSWMMVAILSTMALSPIRSADDDHHTTPPPRETRPRSARPARQARQVRRETLPSVSSILPVR
ncbi:O-antigen ligase family protein [bacterium]|nr:O-antigen ligase family protein [bacterium]